MMLFVVGSIALFCTACGSNNTGKIVGKWKIVSATGEGDAGFKQFETLKLALVFEFKEDGTAGVSIESTDEKPKGGKIESTQFASFKYKLLSGDMVELYDLPKDLQQKGNGGLFGNKDKSREKIKISGDNMTFIEDKTTLNLVRMK
jgi:hypothetical protein